MKTYPPLFPSQSSYSQLFTIVFITFATFLHQLNASIQPVSSVPEGYTSFPSMNMAYRFYDERLTWTEAKSKCMLEGARLAVIDTHPKARNIGELKPLSTYVWIGISRESRGSPWLTDDSSTIISYLPWAPGQPSCFHNCIALGNCDRGVSNENCNARKAFVCERPLVGTMTPRFGGK